MSRLRRLCNVCEKFFDRGFMLQKVNQMVRRGKQLLTEFPKHYAEQSLALSRINNAFSKASVTSALRVIDETDPMTWEFSGFSQNGEDGISDFLSRKLRKNNFYCVEIGSADGIENNTAWFALARKFNGVMIEGNRDTSMKAKRALDYFNPGIRHVCAYVTRNNIIALLDAHVLHKDPDLFSLDIDSVDFYLAREVLRAGYKPKIFVVEYNSAFGPEACITVPYREDYDFLNAHESRLYYGSSLNLWKRLFAEYGYTFVTVERNGVNAFFIDKRMFDEQFVMSIKGLGFQENFCQLKTFGCTWEKQFERIQHLPFQVIDAKELV